MSILDIYIYILLAHLGVCSPRFLFGPAGVVCGEREEGRGEGGAAGNALRVGGEGA